ASFALAEPRRRSRTRDEGLVTKPKPHHYDLVIIGAGVVGSSVALFSKTLNPLASVLLIDGESVGAGASSHSAGTLWLPQCLSESRNQSDVEPLMPAWDEVLSSASADVYKFLESEGYDVELERSGAVLVAGSRKQADYVAKTFLDLAARGYSLKSN